MIKSAEINLTFPAVTKDMSREAQEGSVVEEVLDWLEHKDSPVVMRAALGFCAMSGFFFVAQLVRFLAS